MMKLKITTALLCVFLLTAATVGCGSPSNSHTEMDNPTVSGEQGSPDDQPSVDPEDIQTSDDDAGQNSSGPAEDVPAPESADKTGENPAIPGNGNNDTGDHNDTVKQPAKDDDNSGDVDNSYFDDAVFIGDSLTQGFQMHGGITNATYYGFKNLNVKDVFQKALVSGASGKITIADALRQTSYGKYYIMLGANELGWVYPQVFLDKYSELIALIRETNPDAAIYLQSVLPVTQHVSDTNKYYSNSRIDEFDQMIAQLAEDEQVTFLNVREAVQNESGVLPDDAATDGIHLNKTYCQKWADYLRNNK